MFLPFKGVNNRPDFVKLETDWKNTFLNSSNPSELQILLKNFLKLPFFKGTFTFLYIAFSIQTPHVYFIIADWEMASSPVALVQGANRGLGLAFVRIFASRSSKVVATCRRPDQAEDLQKIPNVEILQVSSILEFTMY